MKDFFKGLFSNVQSTIIVILLSILLVISLVANVWQLFHRDRTIISDDSIREEVVPVARLAVYDYNFTQVMALSESGNPLDWNNPVTSKRYVATIDGSAPIEVDAEQIIITGTYSPSGDLLSVVVTLPHCSVGKIALDHDSLTEYVSYNGWFNINPVTTVDLNSMESQIQEDQRRKLEESDVLARSDERVQDLIAAQIQGLHGEDIDVTFEYIEDVEESGK